MPPLLICSTSDLCTVMSSILTLTMKHLSRESCHVIGIKYIYLTEVNLYPGKKAKLFEYTKGLLPDVAEFDSMREEAAPTEIPGNNSYC